MLIISNQCRQLPYYGAMYAQIINRQIRVTYSADFSIMGQPIPRKVAKNDLLTHFIMERII